MNLYTEVPGVLRSSASIRQEDDADTWEDMQSQEEDGEEMQREQVGDRREDMQSGDEQEIPIIPTCKSVIEYQQRVLDYFNI